MRKKISGCELAEAVTVSLLLPILYALLCLTIHYGNILECTESDFFLALFFFLAPLIWAPVLFLIQYPFFGTRYFNIVNLLIFSAGVLLWFQANLFNWGFASFNGSIINWEVYKPFVKLELLFQIVIIALLLFFRKYLFRKIVWFSLVILVAQMAGLIQTAAPWFLQSKQAAERNVSWLKYDTDESQMFTFSKNKNVILLVIDSFPGFTAERILNEDPKLQKAFSDFIFYKNCRSYPGGTTVNVPAILTGQGLNDEVGTTEQYFTFSNYPDFIYQAYNGPFSVPLLLKESGYRVELYPEVRGVVWWNDRMIDNAIPRSNERLVRYCDNTGMDESCFERVMSAAAFRTCPTCLKKYSSKIEKHCFWNAENTFRPFEKSDEPECFPNRDQKDPDRKFVERIESESPFELRDQNCFKYIHLFGVHVPHQRNALASGSDLYDPENKNAASELTLEMGYLRLAGQFLEKLKQSKIYDSSTIIIMGDHVQHYSLLTNASTRDYLTFDPNKTFYNNPLFLIKRANSQSDNLRVCNDFIEMVDIAPLLIEESGANLPEGLSSFWKPDESLLQTRKSNFEKLTKSFRLDLMNTIKTVQFQVENISPASIGTHKKSRSWFLFNNPEFSKLILFGDQNDEKISNENLKNIDNTTSKTETTSKQATTSKSATTSKQATTSKPATTSKSLGKRTFFLRTENSNDTKRFCFDFTPDVPFHRGDFDDNYKFVKAVFDRDVWCWQCLLDCSNVPDGRYLTGILERRTENESFTETVYNNIITVKNGKIL